MIEGEFRVGEFACNCNCLQVLPDGRLLVLLVCGDQETYVSQIVTVSSDLSTISPLFTVDTWLLAIHFDKARGKLFCSTSGGRILEIQNGEYRIVAEDIPFVSGFRSLSNGRLLAFGWHGLVMELTSEWRRLTTGERRRIFDLKEYGDHVFICGDAGLFAQLDDARLIGIELQTNARLRRLCGYGEALLVLSEAPVIFRFADGAIEAEDVPFAPAWDAAMHQKNLLVGFGYHGLHQYLNPGFEPVSSHRAFRIEPWGNKLAILGDSFLWVREGNKETERTLHAEFRNMLDRYDLL
jgi:hypothetical protein